MSLRSTLRAAAHIAALIAFGFASTAAAQQPSPSSTAVVDCLWDGLDAPLRSPAAPLSRFEHAGTWEDVSQSDILVSLDVASSPFADAVTMEGLAACGAPETENAPLLVILALAARSNRIAAEAGLAGINGAPEGVERAFNNLSARRRADLVTWVLTGAPDDDGGDRVTYAFWTAIDRTRLNRTFSQRRMVSLGLIARLVEYEAVRCLGEDTERQTQCAQVLADRFAGRPALQKDR